MKNMKYFPFERNRYFYGKLLRVNDFETEQRYFNDKRRVLNRFLHGYGVVCGLDVVAVDDQTLSVERGIALDSAGREIVIEQPVTKKLSMFEGFSTYDDTKLKNLYLCMDYMEEGKEPVHSIGKEVSASDGQQEFNKIQEAYHLYLSSTEPEEILKESQLIYEEEALVYEDENYRIRHVIPQCCQSGQEVTLKVLVDKKNKDSNVTFRYQLETLYVGDEKPVNIEFSSKDDKELHEELAVTLNVHTVKDVSAEIRVMDGAIEQKEGAQWIEKQAYGALTTWIVEKDVEGALLKTYYSTGFDRMMNLHRQTPIYLAKINVIKAGDTYIMDEVEAIPFGQTVITGNLLQMMLKIQKEQIEALKGRKQPLAVERKPRMNSVAYESEVKLEEGYTSIELGIGGKEGKTYYSEEIVHGLGLGEVTIELAQVEEDTNSLVFGNPSLFEADGAQPIEQAVKVKPDKGTFTIAIRFLKTTQAKNIRLYWRAMRKNNKEQMPESKADLYIMPDMLTLHVRESYALQTIFKGQKTEEVTWRVLDIDGGSIDNNGIYTAPNAEGVFEIEACIKDQPEFKASAFVVVHELE